MFLQFSSVQSLSRVRLFATPWTAARQASLSITNSQSSLKLTSIESVMPSSHLILCRPLLLPPSMFPSIRLFSNESALRIRWPKHLSFSFSTSPSNEHPGLVSLRMDWLDLLAVQGALKSLLQHHSSKASILRPSAFFTVQLSRPYMTTGKTIALTRQTFVGLKFSKYFRYYRGYLGANFPSQVRRCTHIHTHTSTLTQVYILAHTGTCNAQHGQLMSSAKIVGATVRAEGKSRQSSVGPGAGRFQRRKHFPVLLRERGDRPGNV